jgi:hypothetical protein
LFLKLVFRVVKLIRDDVFLSLALVPHALHSYPGPMRSSLCPFICHEVGPDGSKNLKSVPHEQSVSMIMADDAVHPLAAISHGS